ncbi:nitrogen fixation protein NifZ [Bradyrhizobium sp. BR 10261]|uniref:nitrogen fixation protein NifZ n=1 Tax=Bradyrhizobium sp. BR 10261 TaxID=2749992 RepID=UPI001C65067B|nr:nitrogen fixation protein NifZ [Bradyrhizobium sp. BR 10261]MBW7962592.1 nitrogen fixation protein NifZ [Bradyrhizobium sp. BR 10261]
MSDRIATKRHPVKQRPVARIVCDAHQRRTVRNMERRFTGEFLPGEPVRAAALIRNDGMYPHKDIGEPLVHPGDAGVVRESWRFLGEVYYTVEFVARAVFVIMRGREMVRMGTAFDVA